MSDFLKKGIGNRDKVVEKVQNNLKKDNVLAEIQPFADWMDSVEELDFLKTDTIFDCIFKGLEKTSLYVLCAKSGQGKSLILLSLAMKLSQTYKVLYLSFENSASVDKDRMLKLQAYYNPNYENLYYVDVDNVITTDNIDISGEDITKAASSHKYDVILIDGMQNALDTTEEGSSMYAKGNELMNDLKNSAKKNKIPFVITWQLARLKGVKDEDVTQEDISYSMGITRYAAGIIFLYRTKTRFPLNFKLLKHRHGYGFRSEIKEINNINIPFELEEEMEVSKNKNWDIEYLMKELSLNFEEK